ncbi:acyl carrier protein [Streptomyces sp. NPDC003077]|uniref:acyl carrier protein n=1 Tax=Streptomyces sp. NPDC003077 TaxID=3154443 RepID=UPI0033A0F878
MTHQAAEGWGEGFLAGLLQEVFGIASEQLRDDATFEELELDSFALLELLLIVENRAGVEIEDGMLDISPASTLGEASRGLASAVRAAVAGEGAGAEALP